MLNFLQTCIHHPSETIKMICKEAGCEQALLCSKCMSDHPRHWVVDLETHKEESIDIVSEVISKAKSKIDEMNDLDTSSPFKKLDALMSLHKRAFSKLQSKIITLLQSEMKKTHYTLRSVRKKLKRKLKDYQQEKNELQKIDSDMSGKMSDLGDIQSFDRNSLEIIEKYKDEVDTLCKKAEGKIDEMKTRNIIEILEKIFYTEMQEKKKYFELKSTQERKILDYIRGEVKKLNSGMRTILRDIYGTLEEEKSPSPGNEPEQDRGSKNTTPVLKSRSLLSCDVCPNNLNNERIYELRCKHRFHPTCLRRKIIIVEPDYYCPQCKYKLSEGETNEFKRIMPRSPMAKKRDFCPLCRKETEDKELFLLECGHQVHTLCVRRCTNLTKCPIEECEKLITHHDRIELGLIKFMPKGVPSQRELTKPAATTTPHKRSMEPTSVSSPWLHHSPNRISMDNTPFYQTIKCAHCIKLIEYNEDKIMTCDDRHYIHTDCVISSMKSVPHKCPVTGCSKLLNAEGKSGIETLLERPPRKYSDLQIC